MIIGCITPDGKQDYLAELIIEGFRARGDILVATDLSNGILASEVMADDKFVKLSPQFDMLLVFFGKVRGNRLPKWHLLDRMQNVPKDRIVYIDGSEWTCTGWEANNQSRDSLLDPSKRRAEPWLNEPMLKRVGHYFKRETYQQDRHRGVVPLPFGLFDRHVLSESEKDIDLFCSFGHTRTGLRKNLIEACTQLRKLRPDLNIVVGSGYTRHQFSDMMARSRIAVDAWGGGDCCDRFWEAIGARACCLYQRYNIEMPFPFTDWIHAVSFSDMGEFSKRVDLLLDNPDLTKQIGYAGLEHAQFYHTSFKRANSIMQKVFYGIHE